MNLKRLESHFASTGSGRLRPNAGGTVESEIEIADIELNLRSGACAGQSADGFGKGK